MILKEIQNIFHLELDSMYGKEEVNSFFFILTEHYFGIDRLTLALQPEFMLTKQEETPLFVALSELKLEKPIQYITGKTSFFGLNFLVNKHTLIPRPETEELVEWIIDDSNHKKKCSVLDIGTGSGCIAIALKKQLPQLEIMAIDISTEALQIARENAKLNEVIVDFQEADILTLKAIIIKTTVQKFDLIASNPPYVRNQEKAAMRKNVLEYEPQTALFVEDHDPLVFYDTIANFAVQHLNPGGSLYFEINQYLGKEMMTLLEDKGFKNIELRKDIFGADRMLKAVI